MKRRVAPKPPRKPEVPLGIGVEDLRRLEAGELADPQRVLGPQRASVDGLDGFVVRGFHPDAIAAECLPEGREAAAMKPLAEGGLFGCFLPSATGPLRYRLRFRFRDGSLWEREDPYRFPVIPGEVDLHLFSEGTHRRLWEMLGAHPRHNDGVAGVAFAVWTPNALRVSVVGDFCGWDGRLFPMRHIGGGVFELFIPEVQPGAFYKYEIKTREGAIRPKADPFAFAAEAPPGTASRVAQSVYRWRDAEWMESRRHRNPLREPIAIYEVHLGAWARVPEEGNRWLSYREIAPRLIEHMKRFSFTHVEFLPIAEHPFDGSWGYQLSSYFAPTARYGSPDDLRYLIDLCHRNGIGVILDWVPAHFPRDDFALRRFDGTALYEHEDPRLGEHPDWGTLIFNYERNEVRNFLIANALYWFEEFHIDGLRADAVASMLYRDYSRESSDWIPNHYGGRENLGAVSFLRALNETVQDEHPDCFIVAEESTAWPGVSRPVSEGGLGFTFKWNMGWMHDTLCYLERDPVHRSYHHDEFTFAALYEHTEHFIMPLSHDEVVHGKRSLLEKMPGDYWQKFANLRLLFSYQYTRPGKKLLFMGNELAPHGEWDYRNSLDWHLVNDPPRMGLARLLEALGRLYRQHACLWRSDVDPEGFAWIGCADRENSVFSYLRRSDDDELLIILNATPVPRYDYQIGAPRPGRYVQILSSDYHEFGGSGFDSPAELETEPTPFHGHPQSLRLRLPPLGALVLAPVT